MLTFKQKREIVRKAITNQFPLDKIMLPSFVDMIEKYVEGGNISPKDKLYEYVPQELKNQ